MRPAAWGGLRLGAAAVVAALCISGPARPFASKDLRGQLRATSLLVQADKEKTVAPQDLFAAAQADYGRLIGALYAQGHYSPIIRIQIDGREAAAIELLDQSVLLRVWSVWFWFVYRIRSPWLDIL